MHAQVYTFVGRILGPVDVSGKRVLDIGSYDVNGSVRPFFAASAEYVGIDSRDGPGVDVVSDARDYTSPKPFDFVVSTEALEHADNPADIPECAARCLAPGGLFILTAAGPDRPPHDVDGTGRQAGSYTAIDKKTLTALLSADDWEDVRIEYGESHGLKHGDIYAVATRSAKKKTAKTDEKKGDA